MTSVQTVFYDPSKTFDDNFDNGPFPLSNYEELHNNEGEPQYTFLNHKIYSPFGIPAGALPSSRHIKHAFELGFDVLCYKTQRTIEFPCNKFPNILHVETNGDLTTEKSKLPLVGRMKTNLPRHKYSITNSFGNPSRGPSYWKKDLEKAISSQGKGQLLITSVVGTIQEGFNQEDYFKDFAKAAEIAADAGSPIVELNLSCPNVANEGVICYTKSAVLRIAELVRQRIGDTPLVAKLGYYDYKQQEILESIIKESSKYFNAYSVINTIQAAIVDEHGDQALPGKNRLLSGVCGSGIKWAGIDMVKRLHTIRKQFSLEYEVIGIGGVMSPSDYHEYRGFNADVVQSCTGAMWNPYLATEIKASL